MIVAARQIAGSVRPPGVPSWPKRRKGRLPRDFKKKFAGSGDRHAQYCHQGRFVRFCRGARGFLDEDQRVSDEVGIQGHPPRRRCDPQNDVNLATVDKAVIIRFQRASEPSGPRTSPSARAWRSSTTRSSTVRSKTSRGIPQRACSSRNTKRSSPLLRDPRIFRSSSSGNIAGVIVRGRRVKRGTRVPYPAQQRGHGQRPRDLLAASLQGRRSVRQEGYEAGINLGTFNDIELGDIIEDLRDAGSRAQVVIVKPPPTRGCHPELTGGETWFHDFLSPASLRSAASSEGLKSRKGKFLWQEPTRAPHVLRP